MFVAMYLGRYTGKVSEDSCHEFEQSSFVYNTWVGCGWVTVTLCTVHIQMRHTNGFLTVFIKRVMYFNQCEELGVRLTVVVGISRVCTALVHYIARCELFCVLVTLWLHISSALGMKTYNMTIQCLHLAYLMTENCVLTPHHTPMQWFARANCSQCCAAQSWGIGGSACWVRCKRHHTENQVRAYECVHL